MPERPDLTVCIEHLEWRVTGETGEPLRDIRLASPSRMSAWRAPPRPPPGEPLRAADGGAVDHPSSRITMPATTSTIPASSSAVDRSRKKKYEAMKVNTSSTCPTART